MFTLQSGQIENALRTGGANDASATQMVQRLANCQQVIEHRGPMEMTQPIVNFFPTIQPASNTLTFPFVYKNVNITVPPFQMQEWKPIPFVPLPPWEAPVYPDWPMFGWESSFPGVDSAPGIVSGRVAGAISSQGAAGGAGGLGGAGAGGIGGIGGGAGPGGGVGAGGRPLAVPGGATLGPLVAQSVDTGPIRSTKVSVSGELGVGGPISVQGEANFGGNVFVGGNLNVNGGAFFAGPVNMAGPVMVNGVEMGQIVLPVVTNVVWDEDGEVLRITVRDVALLAAAAAPEQRAVITGTECP